VGIYQANFKIGVFMMLIVSMFDQAWRPFFLSHYAKDENPRPLFAQVFTCFTALSSWVLLGLIFLMPDIIRGNWLGNFHLIAPAYWEGLSVIPLVLTGYFFYGLYVNFMIGPVVTKRTQVLLWITLLGACTSITTNLILVPHIGILGAGWAVLISYAVMATALFCFTRRVYPIPYEYKKLAVLLTTALFFFLLNRWTGNLLGVKILLLVVYPICFWWTLRKTDLSSLLQTNKH